MIDELKLQVAKLAAVLHKLHKLQQLECIYVQGIFTCIRVCKLLPSLSVSEYHFDRLPVSGAVLG